MSIWFEALPTRAGAPADRIARDVDRLEPCAGIVDRILVPEVVDGTHRTIDPYRFAAHAAAATGLPAGAAVLAYTRTRASLAARLEKGRRAGLDRFLLVGPPGRDRAGGTSVEAALRHGPGAGLGVVTIPTRRRWRVDEPHRLLIKQRAGASFAVSQILTTADDALDVRREFVRSLAPHEEPLPVLYSVAPVRRRRDLSFLESLGVSFPPRLHRALRVGSERERLSLSKDASLQALRTLAVRHAEEGLGGFGVCVSHVMVGNVGPALELAAAVRDELRPLQRTTVLA